MELWMVGVSRGASGSPTPTAGITRCRFRRARRSDLMSCPLEPRVTFGQADGIVDGWSLKGCQRVADAHGGHYAMQIPAGQTIRSDELSPRTPGDLRPGGWNCGWLESQGVPAGRRRPRRALRDADSGGPDDPI